jgi:DNA-binding response OmpR family regulator
MTCGHILVVDADPKVRTLLRRCFEGEGFAVSEAKDGSELRAQLGRHPVALITLDLSLGKENGLDLAREIRKERNVPIIMLTGKGDAIDRIVGLELGADDYLAKPFELRELLARVRAVLRRATASEQTAASEQRYAFEGWIFDINRRSLNSETGESQELTTSEFNLLEAFVKRPSAAQEGRAGPRSSPPHQDGARRRLYLRCRRQAKRTSEIVRRSTLSHRIREHSP